MPDPHSSSRCSGTRMRRWAALVVPTAVVLTGSFGASAYAATGGNAAAHTASSSSTGADANHGVGNGVGNGNDKHSDATTTGATDASTASATADATSTSASSTASHQVDCTATPSDPLCSPQPKSNADNNPGGANNGGDCGSYCSTRNGAASGNGNQTQGQHTGEPCAGCVGKADNKNPPGQFKDGSDHNAGYECDRNHGIGRTNPAHTGCKPTTTSTCPTGTVKASDGTCKTPCQINPAGTGCTHNTGGGDCTTHPTAAGCQTETGGGCAAHPSAAGCDNSGAGSTACVPTAANGFCSSVLGEKVTKPAVQGEKVVKKTPGSLPFTGSHIDVLLLAAAVGVGTGSGLLVAGRRRRVHA